MKKKIQLIDKICENHPSYGTEKGWSKYVGGMEDTGEWFFRKMLDVPIEELRAFYDKIEEQKNRSKVSLTKEEEELQKQNIYFEDRKYWMNLLDYKRMQDWKERKVIEDEK